MTTIPKTRLTIEQLHAQQCYIELTQKQKKLVDNFIATGGDRVASVMAAYDVKSVESARVMAYAVLASPRVVACLTTYFQDDPLQSFKTEVQRAYRNRKLTVAQVRAMTLHADLNGWGSASLPGLHGRDDEPVPENPKPQPVVPTASAPSTGRVPPGCRPVRDQAGVLQGYLKPDGQFVPLAVVEATR